MVRWVPAAARYPQKCVFLPQLGSHHELGYFEFGTSFDGLTFYCSVQAARMMAAQMGFDAPTTGPDSRDREIAELRERLDVAEHDRATAEKQLEAVKTLKAAGFTAARGPGRPRKETTMEAA